MTAQASRDRADANGQAPVAPGAERVSPWEWAVAALGLLLVAGTIAFMLYRAIAGGDDPPLIALDVAQIGPAGDGYLVTFTATNEGDEAAADLVVVGELRAADGSVETATATISYVPGGSQRRGGLYFAADPGGGRLTLRPKGYERP